MTMVLERGELDLSVEFAIDLSAWNPQLHPRDSHGRFRDKWGLPPAARNLIDRILKTFHPLTARDNEHFQEFADRAAAKVKRTPEEQATLDYMRTPNGWNDIQSTLRAGKEDIAHVRNFDAMKRPLESDALLTRVMGPEAFGLPPERIGEIEEWTGKLISDKGYTSTNFGEPYPTNGPHVTMSLVVPRGTKAVIPGGSREVMLDREQPIRIMKVQADGKGGVNVYAVVEPMQAQGRGPARNLGAPLPAKEHAPAMPATPEELARRGLGPDGQPLPAAAPAPPTNVPAAPAPGGPLPGKDVGGGPLPGPVAGEAPPGQGKTEFQRKADQAAARIAADKAAGRGPRVEDVRAQRQNQMLADRAAAERAKAGPQPAKPEPGHLLVEARKAGNARRAQEAIPQPPKPAPEQAPQLKQLLRDNGIGTIRSRPANAAIAVAQRDLNNGDDPHAVADDLRQRAEVLLNEPPDPGMFPGTAPDRMKMRSIIKEEARRMRVLANKLDGQQDVRDNPSEPGFQGTTNAPSAPRKAVSALRAAKTGQAPATKKATPAPARKSVAELRQSKAAQPGRLGGGEVGVRRQAVLRHQEIARGMPIVEAGAEIRELIDKKQGNDVIAEHIRHIANGPAMDEIRDPARKAAIKDGLEQLARTFEAGKQPQGLRELGQLERRHRIQPTEKPGALVKFDPNKHRLAEGQNFNAGDQVQVIRPGGRMVHGQGDETQLAKALVGRPRTVAPPKAAPVKRVAKKAGGTLPESQRPAIPENLDKVPAPEVRKLAEAHGLKPRDENKKFRPVADLRKELNAKAGRAAPAKALRAAKKAAPAAPKRAPEPNPQLVRERLLGLPEGERKAYLDGLNLNKAQANRLAKALGARQNRDSVDGVHANIVKHFAGAKRSELPSTGSIKRAEPSGAGGKGGSGPPAVGRVRAANVPVKAAAVKKSINPPRDPWALHGPAALRAEARMHGINVRDANGKLVPLKDLKQHLNARGIRPGQAVAVKPVPIPDDLNKLPAKDVRVIAVPNGVPIHDANRKLRPIAEVRADLAAKRDANKPRPAIPDFWAMQRMGVKEINDLARLHGLLAKGERPGKRRLIARLEDLRHRVRRQGPDFWQQAELNGLNRDHLVELLAEQLGKHVGDNIGRADIIAKLVGEKKQLAVPIRTGGEPFKKAGLRQLIQLAQDENVHLPWPPRKNEVINALVNAGIAAPNMPPSQMDANMLRKRLQKMGLPIPDKATTEQMREMVAHPEKVSFVPKVVANQGILRRILRGRMMADAIKKFGIKSRDRLGGGAMGETTKLTLGNGEHIVEKKHHNVFGVSAKEQADGEQLAAVVAHHMPVLARPAVHRSDGTTILMGWADADLAGNVPGHQRDAAIEGESGKWVGVLDSVIGNADRHSGNWMIGKRTKKAIPIDHGLAWEDVHGSRGFKVRRARDGSILPPEENNTSPFARRWIRDGGDWKPRIEISQKQLNKLRNDLEKERPQFELLGRGDWLDITLERLDAIIARAVLP